MNDKSKPTDDSQKAPESIDLQAQIEGLLSADSHEDQPARSAKTLHASKSWRHAQQPNQREYGFMGGGPAYGGVRRIGLLVIMLVLVVYGMYEAGKPENWNWMGFDQAEQQTQHEPTDEFDEDAIKTTIQAPGAPHHSNEVDTQSRDNPDAEQPRQILDDSADDIWGEFDLTQASREEFWSQVFKKLDRKERLHLFRFVRSLDQPEKPLAVDDDTRQSLDTLIQKLDRFRTAYHGKLLQLIVQASNAGIATNSQPSWSELLLELQQDWEYQVHPALKAGLLGPLSDTQQLAAISWLNETLRRISRDQIKDGTAEIRDVELPAWLDLMESLASQSSAEIASRSLGFVDITQLMGQTSAYRGKVVSIRGMLLRIQRQPISEPIQEQHHVFELWIAPLRPSVFPFSVYALEAPDEFHDVGWEPVNTRRILTLDGILFKRRFFTADDDKPAEAPLLLAKRPTIQVSSEFDSLGPDILSWSGWVWSFVVGAIILAASGISVLAWRSARRRSRFPGHDERKIIDKLSELRTNPEVKTIEERIADLND
ncbi:MAG TPA: hypothetical protein PKD64_03620 [Pirellulaceae bacterium]|nr:hypothetical protein [Pirellulaceae bacterium]HMO91259.1 hypothetical protein [Pirellulaceae bacterium]HMP68557.1 hypothetical protein [Pirellulaceae bacterium]